MHASSYNKFKHSMAIALPQFADITNFGILDSTVENVCELNLWFDRYKRPVLTIDIL